MSSYAILRHRKIKPGRHLDSLGRHNARTETTKNALDGGRPPTVLLGSDRPSRDVMAMLRARGVVSKDRKLKVDANVAVELVAAASPEWWTGQGWVRGETLETMAPVDRLRLERWVEETRAWMVERHGDRLVSLMLHLDEATPHLHAVVVPIAFGKDGREKGGEERWRLSVDRAFGGPRGLEADQTSYAAQMAPLGLVRGEARSRERRVRHKPLAEWQAEKAAEVESAMGLTVLAIEDRRAAADARIEAERLRETARQEAEEAQRSRVRLAERSKALDVREAAVEASERSMQGERSRLGQIAAELERITEPLRQAVRQFAEATGIVRQAMAARGPAPVETVEMAALASAARGLRDGGR